MNLHTFNDGACVERSAVIAHVKRRVKHHSVNFGGSLLIDGRALLTWLHGRVRRNAAKVGGLGRK